MLLEERPCEVVIRRVKSYKRTKTSCCDLEQQATEIYVKAQLLSCSSRGSFFSFFSNVYY